LIEAPELQTRYAEFQSSLQAQKQNIRQVKMFSTPLQSIAGQNTGIVAPVDLERSRNQLLADSASWEAARRLAQSYCPGG